MKASINFLEKLGAVVLFSAESPEEELILLQLNDYIREANPPIQASSSVGNQGKELGITLS